MWRVDLICCGHADGHIVRESWDEADGFRWDYVDAPGHDRSGILTEDTIHNRFCNGYISWATACGL